MAVLYLRDDDLIEGLKDGDDDAVETLLDMYGDRILKVCSIILKDFTSAEDAVQEIFLKVYKNIGRFKGESSLYTWIYRIAVNKCRDLLRKRNEFSPLEEVEVVSDQDVEQEVISSINRESIKSRVLSMAPIYREVVTLFYFEDLSIKEICEILDEAEGTVKSKLHRARNILREAIEKEGLCCEKR